MLYVLCREEGILICINEVADRQCDNLKCIFILCRCIVSYIHVLCSQETGNVCLHMYSLVNTHFRYSLVGFYHTFLGGRGGGGEGGCPIAVECITNVYHDMYITQYFYAYFF